MQNGIKRGNANEVLNFDDINPEGLKKVTKGFEKNDLEVLNLAATNRLVRRNGMSTKKAVYIFAGGQAVELRVNDTGDIYQVSLNNKVSPFREQKKIAYLIKDIATSVKKNQVAFDKSMLKKITAATRKETKQVQSGGSSTVAQRVEKATDLKTQLTERVKTLRQLISTLDKDIASLEAKINTETNNAKVGRETLAQLKKQLKEINDKAAN